MVLPCYVSDFGFFAEVQLLIDGRDQSRRQQEFEWSARDRCRACLLLKAWLRTPEWGRGSAERRAVRQHSLSPRTKCLNLILGPSYCNMDFMVASALRDRDVDEVVISYDIACQWYKNLAKRIRGLPDSIQDNIARLLDADGVDFFVPKMHLSAHKAECYTKFSSNLREGNGRNCGEEPERVWSKGDDSANSTKEMRLYHRQDTLNTVFNQRNWGKLVHIGE